MNWFWLLAFALLGIVIFYTLVGKSKVVVVLNGTKVLTTFKTACSLDLKYQTPGKVRYVTNYTIVTADKNAYKFWLLDINDLGDVVIKLTKIKGVEKVACNLNNEPYLFYDEINGVVQHFNIKA